MVLANSNLPTPSSHRGVAAVVSTRLVAVLPHRLRRGRYPSRISPRRISMYSVFTASGDFRGRPVFFMSYSVPTKVWSQERFLLTSTLLVRTLVGMENKTLITDGITAGIEPRKQRGLEIAALARIEKKDGVYLVPSQTNPRPTKYRVCRIP